MAGTAHGGQAGHGRTTGARTSTWPTAVQKAAAGVGAVFLLVGIFGFIPGVTSNFNQLSTAGASSDAMRLGVFQVSVVHNLIHLAFGVAGLAMARTYLVGGGVIYLVVWLYGLMVDKTSTTNFIPVNAADDWLHLALGAGMLALALGNRGSAHRLGEGRR